MIDRRHFIASGLAAIGGTLSGCATTRSAWVTLVDSAAKPSFDGWAEVGKGNWSFAEGTLQGKAGTAGFLVSKDSYADFEMRVEFWADADCNSGIFLRCQDRATITADNAYEVNIFDRRPDPATAPQRSSTWPRRRSLTRRRPTAGTPLTSRPAATAWWWPSTACRRRTCATPASRPARWRCSLRVARSAGAR